MVTFALLLAKANEEEYAKGLTLQSLLLINLGKGELHCDSPKFSFVFKREPFKGNLDLIDIQLLISIVQQILMVL